MRRFIKTIKNSIFGKILNVTWRIFLFILEVLIVFLAIVIVTQRLSNNQSAFLGFRIFNVATGSMEPEYAVGDILISRAKDPELIKVGDNIVYLGTQGGYDGKIITHNVIKIEQNEKGEYLFHTKGRANTVEDPIVHEEQLYGTIVHNNKALAFLCKVLLNRYGLYFCVIMPLVIWAFIGFVKAQGEKLEAEKAAEKERRRIQEEKRAKKQRKLRQLEREQALREQEESQEEEEIEVIVEKPKKKSTTTRKKSSKKQEAEEIIE